MKGTVGYFQVILGGPFEPRIEYILHNREALMNAPVIQPFGSWIHITIRKLDSTQSQPCQYDDILIKLDENDPNTVRDGVYFFDMESQITTFPVQNASTPLFFILQLFHFFESGQYQSFELLNTALPFICLGVCIGQ